MSMIDRFRGPWDDESWPRRRFAEAVRAAQLWLLRTDTDDDAVTEAAERLETVVRQLPPTDRTSRYEDEEPRPGFNPNERGTHPVVGWLNMAAPPIEFAVEDGCVVADITYDARHEGMPSLVHGGHIAAAFDIVLAQALVLEGLGGMTGTLSVRFAAPTPVGRPLRYESWVDGAEGRKHRAKGRLVLRDADTVCAEAEGVFIMPRGFAGPRGAPS